MDPEIVRVLETVLIKGAGVTAVTVGNGADGQAATKFPEAVNVCTLTVSLPLAYVVIVPPVLPSPPSDFKYAKITIPLPLPP